MNLLKNLFSTKPKPTYEHPLLGTIQALGLKGVNTTWSTTWEVGSESVELLLRGTEQTPSAGSLAALEKIVSTPVLLDEAKAAVLDTLRNADEAYPTEQFKHDMRLAAISVEGADVFEISYEQRSEPFYHFNVLFRNGRSDGVSIDS